MSVRFRNWMWVILALLPPYAMLFLGIYWYSVDTDSPLTLVYQQAKFVDTPASSRESAAAHAITEGSAGSIVWVWREICLKRLSSPGIGSAIWIEMKDATPMAFAWSSPQRAFHEREGCYARSFGPIALPDAVGKVLDYHFSVSYDNNPLRTVRTVFPPIRIWVLP